MRVSRFFLAGALCTVALIAGAAIWLLASGARDYAPLQLGLSSRGGPNGHVWVGAVHVHTELSHDANGTLEEIAAAAAAAELDFVVIADHTTSLGTAGRVETGWIGDVLVIAGEEISTESGHLLALGLRSHPYALGPTAAQALRDIRSLGGAAFVAHPDGAESAWRSGWSSVAGVEIASLSSVLAQTSWARLLGSLVIYPWNAEAAMARFGSEAWTTLEQWDRVTAAGLALAAIGSVDAHGPIGPARFPSYGAAFGTLATIVWMPEVPPRLDPEPDRRGRTDAARITAALIQGRAATVVTSSGRADGLSFVAWNPGGEVVSPGAVVDVFDGPWKLLVELGQAGPYRIELLRDGLAVTSSQGEALRYEAGEPGVYRASVWRTDRSSDSPWIVTNPVYVWPAARIAASRILPLPMLPAPPTDEQLLSLPGWTAESDPTSHSSLALVDGGLVWQAGVPRQVEEGSYAALAWRPEEPRDWHGHGGLVAGLRSEPEGRVSLRLWTRDEAGELRTWERVVPSSPEAPRVPAPWSSFRRIDRPGIPAQIGVPQLELARVEGVALVVTPQLVRPGSEPRVAVEFLGRFDGQR